MIEMQAALTILNKPIPLGEKELVKLKTHKRSIYWKFKKKLFGITPLVRGA